MIILVVIQIIINIVIALISAIRDYINSYVDQKVETDIKLNIIKLFLQLPIHFYDRTKIGEVFQRIGDSGVILSFFNTSEYLAEELKMLL